MVSRELKRIIKMEQKMVFGPNGQKMGRKYTRNTLRVKVGHSWLL